MLEIIWRTFLILFCIFCSNALTLNFRNHQNDHHLGSLHLSTGSKTLPHQQLHNYYNMQETRRVSASRSIQYLNQCKDLCLEMHQLFPFEFKYHRLVYRQQEGDMKYIIGQCFYTFRASSQESKSLDENEQNKKAQWGDKNQNSSNNNKKWYSWKNLKQFIDMSVVQDEASRQQKKAWESYSKDCEDDSVKLSESSRIDFKFSIVHSDFQYYQNQGFKNLKPFDDFDSLLGGLSL